MIKSPLLQIFTALSLVIPITSIEAKPQRCVAMHGDSRYASGVFNHFESVNPKAPKGGKLRLGAVGTFDSLNPFSTKGLPAGGVSLMGQMFVHEPLMRRVPGEPFSLCGSIAESMDMAPDRTWVIFKLNPHARFQDGSPIMAKDVVSTHQVLKEKGRPNLRLFHSKVEKVESLDERTVKFTFKQIKDKAGKVIQDPELPLLMGLQSVLPKAWLDTHDIEKANLDPLPGSGPYKIANVKPGHSVTYTRDPNYWAKDLPQNVGIYNFDTIQFDYYRDVHVAFEAFKAGEVDFRDEGDLNLWNTAYDFKAVKEGNVTKEEIKHNLPQGMTGLAFNTRRDVFKDIQVRKALSLVLDFAWLNQTLFHNAYTRTTSYFSNCELSASGVPQGLELSLLEPYRDTLPPEVFQDPNLMTPTPKGQQEMRTALQQADNMLKQAGWTLKDGQRVHEKNGTKLNFEILLHLPEHEKIALAYARNLKPLGIIVTVRTVEPTQYESRRLKFDFDMIVNTWGHTLSPGNEQTYYWSTKAADEPGSRNYSGIKSPIVDALCDKVARAQSREELVASIHALDRILLAGHYAVPLGYNPTFRLAYWKKLEHPKIEPTIAPDIKNWWSKETEKSADKSK